MTNSLRDRIVERVKRRYTSAAFEDLGNVKLQSLTEGELAAVQAAPEGKGRAMLVAKSLVDENDKRVFADADVDLLTSLDAATINGIAQLAMEHNAPLKRAEDVRKN